MTVPRIALVIVVLVLLARAARVAWGRRELARAVWGGIRPRHVVGSIGLLVVVVSVAVLAAAAVPALGRGLGDLFATTGNAVFVPVDVAAEATGATSTAGPNLAFLAVVTVFLGLLGLLLPWFAFVEEEVFRAGAEAWGLPRRLLAALVFGAAHLVMLVPLAAALGIAVAGFVYGEVYRRSVIRPARPAPTALIRAFRPTRRSAAAVQRVAQDVLDAHRQRARQVDGLYASTVWHTTFNTTVVTLVWVTFLLDAVAR